MKLLISLCTYNRLDYTKRTLQSLWNNTSDDSDYYIIMVDNASTDGTQKAIKGWYDRARIDDHILNKENLYPGAATNLGWKKALKKYDATHLMRLDNDIEFKKDWDKQVEKYFTAIPELGQLGIDHEAIEHPSAELRKRTINGFTINEWPGCVGGPCVVRRKLWEEGMRWPEMKWDDGRNSAGQEDSAFSRAIQDKGYLTGHAQEELARTFANKTNWSDFPEYYLKTMENRGYDENVKYLEDL